MFDIFNSLRTYTFIFCAYVTSFHDRPQGGLNFTVGPLHCANIPMYYADIFKIGKNDNIQMKNCDVFLIFDQNIDHTF